MARRKTIDEAAALQSYYQNRVEPLAKRLLDVAHDLFSEQSLQRDKEFEEHVERRIKNGAKFVPRKRQSS
jgi:hypothetical protein